MRAADQEILDARTYGPAELRGNLADLRFYGRWTGGSRLLLAEIGRLLPSRAAPPGRMTLLDVGTGSADFPLAAVRWGSRLGIEVEAHGVDTNPDVVSEARRFLSSNRSPDGAAGRVGLILADARRLPYPDGSVDVVTCSNFLHHLDPDDAVRALGEAARVSRLGVVILDLRRGPISPAVIWLLTRLTTRNRLTLNDGILSARRAFTLTELSRLA
ncbi:MAG TPA: methyltransferase domain-containing protein, partial [Candidatus Polarisedimenticolia bacterium]|nr:methyltransferase domain-containing protein [Candidatus Polarisedimenticolia bacterium]